MDAYPQQENAVLTPAPADVPTRSFPSQARLAFAQVTGVAQSVFLLVIRVVWGWQFFVGGKPKLEHPERFVEAFKSWGFADPGPNIHNAGLTETVGGLLLLFGLFGRLGAIPLTVTMLVAYWTAHHDALWSLDKFVVADPFPFLATALVVLLFGPGAFSVDRLFRRFGGWLASDRSVGPTPAVRLARRRENLALVGFVLGAVGGGFVCYFMQPASLRADFGIGTYVTWFDAAYFRDEFNKYGVTAWVAVAVLLALVGWTVGHLTARPSEAYRVAADGSGRPADAA